MLLAIRISLPTAMSTSTQEAALTSSICLTQLVKPVQTADVLSFPPIPRITADLKGAK